MAIVPFTSLLTGSSTPLLASGDVLAFVDVSDSTQAPAGSTVKATLTEFFAAIPVPVVVTSASANALAVGRLGATTPAFQVDASPASQVAGLKVTGAATGGTVAVVVIDSGANANLTLNAKGTGTIGIGSVSTGAVTITPATTITGAVTLSSTLAVTGTSTLTGSVVFTANGEIRQNTSDGADNQGLFLRGGGAGGDDRGAAITLGGNESANTGAVLITAGNVANGNILFTTGGLERVRIAVSGAVTLSSTLTITGAVTLPKIQGPTEYSVVVGSAATETLIDLSTLFTSTSNRGGFVFVRSSATKGVNLLFVAGTDSVYGVTNIASPVGAYLTFAISGNNLRVTNNSGAITTVIARFIEADAF